jgi:osmotically-inducible protein OsmY
MGRSRPARRPRVRSELRRSGGIPHRQRGVKSGLDRLVARLAALRALRGSSERQEPPDDVTLAQKVRSTAFREARVPKEHVSVNAERGVVFLRGQLDDERQIDSLARMVAAVEGVREVRNMLHTSSANDNQ